MKHMKQLIVVLVLSAIPVFFVNCAEDMKDSSSNTGTVQEDLSDDTDTTPAPEIKTLYRISYSGGFHAADAVVTTEILLQSSGQLVRVKSDESTEVIARVDANMVKRLIARTHYIHDRQYYRLIRHAPTGAVASDMPTIIHELYIDNEPVKIYQQNSNGVIWALEIPDNTAVSLPAYDRDIPAHRRPVSLSYFLKLRDLVETTKTLKAIL